ncbi:MAG: sulfatase-like hydrolase/transferase, partial [Verrucomicrobia bacterium]|nr:sulfatase-like hydrolase/transferase [Verrucomicrobiota bacterium]
VDRLAREGMRFTHAHTPAALCSPTRYSLLTGNYPWRGRAPGSTWGFHVPSQILPGQKTVANLLKNAGYHTAMFGKQGFGGEHAKLADGNPDFTKPMIEGLRAWGFDYSAIIPRGHQALPLLFLVNELPEVGADKLIQGKTVQRGVCVDYSEPNWDHSKVGGRLLDHAEKFLDLHQRERKDAPFFMHFCTDGGHAPYVPAETIRGTPLKGQTKMTEHTDMVMEPDILLGKLMAMLEQRGLLANTVICFTSDNGGLPYERNFGHDAVGGLREKKSFIFEGGHRVPFLVRWPGKVAAGSVRDQFVCIHDIAPTLVELAGAKVPGDQCLDSVSLVPVLLGQRDDSRPVRRVMLIDSSPGRDVNQDGGFTDASVVLTREGTVAATRKQAPAAKAQARAKGKAAAKGKGAGKIRPDEAAKMPSHGIAHAIYEGDFKLMLDVNNDAPDALYDLKNDLAEQKNLIAEPAQAERVKRMEATYRAIRASKRSVDIIAAPLAQP